MYCTVPPICPTLVCIAIVFLSFHCYDGPLSSLVEFDNRPVFADNRPVSADELSSFRVVVVIITGVLLLSLIHI